MIEIYWRRRQKSNYTVCSEAIYADIETAHNEDYSKTWMVSCQLKFAGSYKMVRTPTEFIDYLKNLIDTFDLNPSRRIFCYFHNLSFDLSYLLPWIQMYLPDYENRSGIYDGRNRIITYVQGCFEFRCTYLLSACSLERWCEEMNAEHKKKVGLYDYNRELFQDSELDLDSALYDEYDILSMEDCLRAQMQAYNDTLGSIPLTSTAYIRRILRNACQADKNYRKDIFLRSMIDADAYGCLLKSYAGGYTHQNRFLKCKTIYAGRLNTWPDKKLTLDLRGKTIKHKDFRSHYPSQMRSYMLPWGAVDYYYNIKNAEDYRKIYGHYITPADLFNMYPKYTTISEVRIRDLRLKNKNISMPFMQNSKMFDTIEGQFYNANDNGRSLATSGEFTTFVDNLTLKILADQYDLEGHIVILKVYRFENTKCPEPIARVIDDLFKKKSDYKIEYKRCKKKYGENDERTITALFNLNQSKKLLNAIYGCCSTAIVRTKDDIDWIGYYDEDNTDVTDPYISTIPDTPAEKQAIIDKFYRSRNSFLPYQVGVMICASARYELYEFIKTIGYDNVLYCDTDSIFYISDQETERNVKQLNATKHKTAPFIVNSKGEEVYYDVFEDEPEIVAFRGLHSKCYAVVEESDEGLELTATIAGVPKRTIIGMKGEEPIYLYREEELAGISADEKIRLVMAGDVKPDKTAAFDPFAALEELKEGKKFTVNTGFSAKYITEEKAGVYLVDGHLVETSGGCIIKKLPEKEIHDYNLIKYRAEFSDLYVEGF